MASLSLNCLKRALSIIYRDKDYMDKEVKSELSLYGIKFISQLKKNMSDHSWFDNYRNSRLRKPIETVFSSLEQLGIESVHVAKAYRHSNFEQKRYC